MDPRSRPADRHAPEKSSPSLSTGGIGFQGGKPAAEPALPLPRYLVQQLPRLLRERIVGKHAVIPVDAVARGVEQLAREVP